jgi:hypothetical protein
MRADGFSRLRISDLLLEQLYGVVAAARVRVFAGPVTVNTVRDPPGIRRLLYVVRTYRTS